MLKGKMEFRLGSEQRVCGPSDVVVIPGGTEHEAWFREHTEVIDFFAPPRDDPTRRQTGLHGRRLNSSLFSHARVFPVWIFSLSRCTDCVARRQV
jgi:hypothetical protein